MFWVLLVIYALPVICLIMCLICLVKNGFNASACLVCFEFTICRFHSNDFLINTKFLKLKSIVFNHTCKIWTNWLSRLNKNEIFCNSDWNDLDSISLLKNFRFLKIELVWKRQNSNTFKIWEFLTIKTCTVFLKLKILVDFHLTDVYDMYACLAVCVMYAYLIVCAWITMSNKISPLNSEWSPVFKTYVPDPFFK